MNSRFSPPIAHSRSTLPPLEFSPTIVYVLGFEDEFRVPTFISENIGSFLGFTEHEVMSAGWWQTWLAAPDRDIVRAAVRQACARGDSNTRFHVHHKDGRRRWVECQMRAVKGASVNPRHLLCIWKDVSAEEQRREEAVA